MKLSAQILLAFSIVILLSVADSYTNYVLSRKVELNTIDLSKSEAVIRNSNIAHKSILQMQSTFRGYLLTSDTTFLESYYIGKNEIPALLARQKKLVKSNATQRAILDSIALLHNKWVEYSQGLITARENKSETYNILFETKVRKQFGKLLNDEITTKFVRFDKIEYRLRNKRSALLQTLINRTHTVSLIFLTLTIIIGFTSTVYIVRLISKRIQMMVRLAKNISRGNFSVVRDTSNDELTSLSTSLNIMSGTLSKSITDLENRNAELNKFAYVVSHDLKAPIRGIHNVVTWIEEDFGNELSPEVRKYLNIIPQRTKRMEALINGLLDYARISKETPAEEIDTNALVHEIADSLVPRHFKVEIDNLPKLYAERIKLEQVFANLISNSVKFIHDVNGHIRVRCKEFPGYYEFSVSDNGIGIDPEYHHKIFEIFQTLRGKDEKESTGIGLAIVKKIIQEQHGIINVKSASGQGAEFIFTWKK